MANVLIWSVPLAFLFQVPLKAIAGGLYVRVSVHVYSEMEDIERLAHAVSDIRKKNSNK